MLGCPKCSCSDNESVSDALDFNSGVSGSRVRVRVTGDGDDELGAFGTLILGGGRGLRKSDVYRNDSPGVEGLGAVGRGANCPEVDGRGVAGRGVEGLKAEDDERLLAEGLATGVVISFSFSTVDFE
jgi:hypothetical protein